MAHSFRIGPAGLVSPPGLFRILLACIVVVNHSIPLHLGTAAVYLFFMLSGFWVYRMWGREYAPSATPYRLFILSRLWRLLPVYYVGLAMLLLVRATLGTDGRHGPTGHALTLAHVVFSHLLILGYATQPDAAKLMLPVWSLDIELQFYLVAPWLIALLAKFGPHSLPRLALFAASALGLLAFVVFYPSIHAQSAVLPMYLAFFLVGLVTADRDWRPSAGLAVGGLGAALALAAACILLPATRPLLIEGSFSTWLTDYNPDANLVLALLVAPYAMATVRQTPGRAGRLDRHLSNITYEIYVLHWPALQIEQHFFGDRSRYQQIPEIFLTWLCLGALAVLVYIAIDQPIDRRRSMYVRSRTRLGG